MARNKASIIQTGEINLVSAGTRQSLSASDVFCDCVVLRAKTANTGILYIGGVDVTAATGLILEQGDVAILNAIEGKKINLKDLYLDGGTTNDDLYVSYGAGFHADLSKRRVATA